MEMNLPNGFGAAEKNNGEEKKREDQKQGSEDDNNDSDSDSDMPSSLSLRELSKVILPPLGVSSFTDGSNRVKSNRWIISPMSSRYRYSYKHKFPTYSLKLIFSLSKVVQTIFSFCFLNKRMKPFLFLTCIQLFS